MKALSHTQQKFIHCPAAYLMETVTVADKKATIKTLVKESS